MATKHTPGPWTARRFGHDLSVYADREDKSWHRIAFVDFATNPIDFGDAREGLSETIAQRTAANAALIAAAPDLLEALRSFPGFIDEAALGDPWIEKMRAAIYKA